MIFFLTWCEQENKTGLLIRYFLNDPSMPATQTAIPSADAPDVRVCVFSSAFICVIGGNIFFSR